MQEEKYEKNSIKDERSKQHYIAVSSLHYVGSGVIFKARAKVSKQ